MPLGLAQSRVKLCSTLRSKAESYYGKNATTLLWSVATFQTLLEKKGACTSERNTQCRYALGRCYDYYLECIGALTEHSDAIPFL